MADLTTGRLALLRDRLAWDTEPHCLSTADFAALLDMAERCAKAEAELAKHRQEAERFDSEEWTNDRSDA